ncbi:hypothetical protein M440DRAFT_204762 [Trichoderma longibrachiatum ATCC 18648]|uniref:Secreted protein n=1 Tax=Trichoderma longibrachiatum ATCC 18648 TaxID=983965 RepID=A0A2T4CGY9_TRILO|nr:hypothetical protein M440DRAFT_204762 [Trichoderma longibrachiatum ATCC 18648]
MYSGPLLGHVLLRFLVASVRVAGVLGTAGPGKATNAYPDRPACSHSALSFFFGGERRSVLPGTTCFPLSGPYSGCLSFSSSFSFSSSSFFSLVFLSVFSVFLCSSSPSFIRPIGVRCR